jgi:Homeodomain-like domain
MALTREQEKGLALFRAGRSTAEVAEALGVPRPTVWRWQQELPEFIETLRGRSERDRPWTWRETVRVASAVAAVLLAALFLWLSYR